MSQYDPNCNCAACNIRRRESEKQLQAIMDMSWDELINKSVEVDPELIKRVDDLVEGVEP